MIRLHGRVRDIAAASALTLREWEGLARFAVAVESIDTQGVATKVLEDYRDKKYRNNPQPVEVKLDHMEHLLLLEVWRVMREAELRPAGFVTALFPNLPPQLPALTHADDLPLSWWLVLRTKEAQSPARQKGEQGSVAPTLAEQHGAAKKV